MGGTLECRQYFYWVKGKHVALAIFDLDNTLLAGDSDHAWGEFLVQQGLVDAQVFKDKNDDFTDNTKQAG